MRSIDTPVEFFSSLEPRLLLSGDGVAERLESVESFSIAQTVSRPMVGDVNGDDLVNETDLAALMTHWGATGEQATWQNGNFNGDETIDELDLALLLRQWGVRPRPAAEPAPEPELVEPEPVVDPLAGWSVNVIGDTLTILGTDGDDSFTLAQTGQVLTMTVAGQSFHYSGVARIVARMGAGNDTVILLDSVLVPAWIYGGDGDDYLQGGSGDDYLHGGTGNNVLIGGAGNDTLVSLGGGVSQLTGGEGQDVFWATANDVIAAQAAEIALGSVHRVASFYQPWTTDPTSPDYVTLELNGPDLRDPTPTSAFYTYANYSHHPLFNNGPELTDLFQGFVGDCYYLAGIGSMAYVNPDTIRSAIVDLGDGTYAVRFYNSYTRQPVYLRLDADLPSRYGQPAYAGLSDTGELWVALMEKAWAYYRRGENSYASTNSGWMSEVYTALSTRQTISRWFDSTASGSQIYTMVRDLLNQGYALTVGSRGTASGPIVAGHAYTIAAVETDASGGYWITVHNPWGYDGGTASGDTTDGFIRLAAQDMATYFSAMSGINLA